MQPSSGNLHRTYDLDQIEKHLHISPEKDHILKFNANSPFGIGGGTPSKVWIGPRFATNYVRQILCLGSKSDHISKISDEQVIYSPNKTENRIVRSSNVFVIESTLNIEELLMQQMPHERIALNEFGEIIISSHCYYLIYKDRMFIPSYFAPNKKEQFLSLGFNKDVYLYFIDRLLTLNKEIELVYFDTDNIADYVISFAQSMEQTEKGEIKIVNKEPSYDGDVHFLLDKIYQYISTNNISSYKSSENINEKTESRYNKAPNIDGQQVIQQMLSSVVSMMPSNTSQMLKEQLIKGAAYMISEETRQKQDLFNFSEFGELMKIFSNVNK